MIRRARAGHHRVAEGASLALIATLALTACGSGSSSPASSAPASSPVAPPSSAAAEGEVDCQGIANAFVGYLALVDIVTGESEGADAPITAEEAAPMQTAVDALTRMLPPLSADAEEFLSLSQDMASLMAEASAQGLTYGEARPEFQMLRSDPLWDLSLAAFNAEMQSVCPDPQAS